MSRWDKVPKPRKEALFAYNRQRAADSAAAADMQRMAEKMAQLPPGQLKKLLDEEIIEILSRYGVEVSK